MKSPQTPGSEPNNRRTAKRAVIAAALAGAATLGGLLYRGDPKPQKLSEHTSVETPNEHDTYDRESDPANPEVRAISQDIREQLVIPGNLPALKGVVSHVENTLSDEELLAALDDSLQNFETDDPRVIYVKKLLYDEAPGGLLRAYVFKDDRGTTITVPSVDGSSSTALTISPDGHYSVFGDGRIFPTVTIDTAEAAVDQLYHLVDAQGLMHTWSHDFSRENFEEYLARQGHTDLLRYIDREKLAEYTSLLRTRQDLRE